MASTTRFTAASALIGGLMVLGSAPAMEAQCTSPEPAASAPLALTRAGAAQSGAVLGEVKDELGQPLAGAVVSIVGTTTSFAVADEQGRFEFPGLPPGSYRIRAHATGYVAPKLRAIDVPSGGKATSVFRLSRAESQAPLEPPTVLAAGIGVGAQDAPSAAVPGGTAIDSLPERVGDESDVTWRLRHVRRGVLREVSVPGDLLIDDEHDSPGLLAGFAGRAVSSPGRFAASLFADMPLTGQFQLLTTNSFDTPQELLTRASVARGIAFVKVGAPVGERGDWTVRGAITEADIASWFVAGEYKTRGTARRAHDVGMSYSIQRYVGGNPLALRSVTDGARNAGTVYAFETFTFTPGLAMTYGGRYARYDYLGQRNLISPRASLSLEAGDATRISVAVSSRADAPGAMEFLPSGENGLWLPPQRTFSSMERDSPLRAQRSTQVDAGMERALGPTTVVVRGFRQHVDDQLVTVFGIDAPEFPGSRNGHYVVGTAGDVDAAGGSVALRSALGSRVRGSVAYSVATARMLPAGSLNDVVLGGPASVRGYAERLHDVSASIQAEVPETSTRVLVFYRIGNGYASDRGDTDAPGLDSRFDVQVRQSLPFLNFTSAKWEMLVAVRNFFRDPESDQSIYDELLTVRAPKRLVGGVALHF